MVALTTPTRDERFFRNPDLQLRPFGVSGTPEVSFNQNVTPSRSRQPVIVTGATSWTAEGAFESAAAACAAGMTAAGFGADCAAAARTDLPVGVICIETSAARAATGPGPDWDAVISAAAATTHVTPITMARELIGDGTRMEVREPVELLDRTGRVDRLFRRSDIRLNEIF